MNKHAKKKWVAALRSGKYEQTTGTLCRTELSFGRPAGYCCLGVAIEELAPEFLVPESEFSARKIMGTKAGYIPDDFAILFDIPMTAQVELSEQNDHGKTFLQIAEWIEENL